MSFIRGPDCPPELNFIFVYIREAHASDVWPMKWAVEWPEPRSLEARVACAQRCEKDLDWSPEVQVFVDTMDDGFCNALGAWPAGGYVLEPGGRLLFVCAPPRDTIFFDTEELFGYLRGLTTGTMGD